jgi:hypothetical protein
VETLDELSLRLDRMEDESAIRRLVLFYGPAADAGLAALAASLWFEDGQYDWDAGGSAFEGRAGVDAMLRGDNHLAVIGSGVVTERQLVGKVTTLHHHRRAANGTVLGPVGE